MAFGRSQMGCCSNNVCAQHVTQTISATIKPLEPVTAAQEFAAAFTCIMASPLQHVHLIIPAMVCTHVDCKVLTVLSFAYCIDSIK